MRFISFFGDRSEEFIELNERAKEYAAQKGIEYKWVPQIPYSKENVIEELNDAEVGLIDVEPYDEDFFSRLNDRCKLLIRFGVGFDKVDLEAAKRHHVDVARTAGANKTAVAEMALTHILAVRRQLPLNRKVIESGKWEKNLGNELLGKKVGILGFGNVGIALAQLLQGFSCEILAYDPYPNEKAAEETGARYAGLDEIFSTCDAISIHLPYLPETHHLIGRDLLAKMKKTAVITCTARGNIIDEDALCDALDRRQLAGAGLDVFAEEPLPVSSRLFQYDNVVLTPHVASQTYDSLWNIYEKAIDIAADYFSGKVLSRTDLLT